MGKLIIFSAPSGSGKSTIINYLLTQNLNLAFSISATSRPPRGTEQNGVEYFFLTPEEFKQRIANNEFLEIRRSIYRPFLRHTESTGRKNNWRPVRMYIRCRCCRWMQYQEILRRTRAVGIHPATFGRRVAQASERTRNRCSRSD